MTSKPRHKHPSNENPCICHCAALDSPVRYIAPYIPIVRMQDDKDRCSRCMCEVPKKKRENPVPNKS